MSTLEMPQPSDDNSNNNENIVQPGDDTAQEATKASEEWLEALGEPDGNELADASRKHLVAINSLITTFGKHYLPTRLLMSNSVSSISPAPY